MYIDRYTKRVWVRNRVKSLLKPAICHLSPMLFPQTTLNQLNIGRISIRNGVSVDSFLTVL